MTVSPTAVSPTAASPTAASPALRPGLWIGPDGEVHSSLDLRVPGPDGTEDRCGPGGPGAVSVFEPHWCFGDGLDLVLEWCNRTPEGVRARHGGRDARLMTLTATVRPDGTLAASSWAWLVVDSIAGATAPDELWRVGAATPAGPVPTHWASLATQYETQARSMWRRVLHSRPASIPTGYGHLSLTRDAVELRIAALDLPPAARCLAGTLLPTWTGTPTELQHAALAALTGPPGH